PQEQLGSLPRIYYKATGGAIIVFDLNDEQSFEGVRNWQVEIVKNTSSYGIELKSLPMILVGNKLDLVNPECISSWNDRIEEYILEQNQSSGDLSFLLV